jgi:hypothetical protein
MVVIWNGIVGICDIPANLLDCFIELILPSACDKNKGIFLDELLGSSNPTISARDVCNLSKSFFI